MNFNGYHEWLLEYRKQLFLKQGDLKRRFEEKGLRDPFTRDVYFYGNDQNMKALKKKFKSYWNHVESVPEGNYSIFRGVSYTQDSARYQFWNDVLGDRETTSTSPIPFVRDSMKYSLLDYTSWTRDFNVAKGYAEGRPGEIKVLMRIPVNKVKVLAFLEEIGDESEEIIVYPSNNTEIFYKAWRTK